ncbi:MAG: hypothetical protein IT230_03875 [Flavobacteriales bacterium]|nr:hypothetical protein [Flavobacteriales bacterium]
MIKLFTLFNLAGLLLFNLLFSGGVSISQDLPARMDPGTEVRVTVTVNKEQISGFAKLQIDLPPGMRATAIETRGASFTFADGKAKFIWMALPAQPSFKVSYTLSADAGINGSFPIGGRISYIEDNERKTADMPPSTITVGNAALAAATAPAATPDATAAPAEAQAPAPAPEAGTPADVAASIIPDGAVTDTPGLPAKQGPGQVGGSRTITPVSNTEVLVEVTINKGLLRGFGKLQENLPAGFTAVATANDEAIFSTGGRMAKFVWLNLPSKSELKVAYRLLAPAGSDGSFTINGDFGYLLNDLTQRAVIGSSTFQLDAQAAVAVAAPAVKAPEPEPAQPEPAATATAQQKDPQPAAVHEPAPKITAALAPETGITYKVQITAAHREVGKPYFVQRHRFNGDFSIEHHEGWIKYVTGRFDRYGNARDQRQAYIDAGHNFPGPFVTAYNNGDRITVQEALMIAKQSSVQ